MKTKAIFGLIIILVWLSIYAWKAFTGTKEKMALEEKLETLDNAVIENKNLLRWVWIAGVAIMLGMFVLVDFLKHQ